MYRWLALLLVLGLVLGLGLFFWEERHPSGYPMNVTLQDGSKFRIHQVSYGTTVLFPKPTLWEKLILKLPPKLRLASSRPIASIGLGESAVAIVYELDRKGSVLPNAKLDMLFDATQHDRPEAKSLLSLMMERKRLRATEFYLVDENGLENGQMGNRLSQSPGFGGTNKLDIMSFASFPRRSKRLTLRVVDPRLLDPTDQTQPIFLGEVTFPNPAITRVAPLPKPVMPQKQAARETTVRLLDATWGRDPSQSGDVTGRALSNWTTLKLDFRAQNQIRTNWAVVSVKESDASGNSASPQSLQVRWESGVCYLSFRDLLTPAEPIRYSLEVRRQSDFPTNEELTVRGVAAPLIGETIVIGATGEFFGQEFRLDRIVGHMDKVSFDGPLGRLAPSPFADFPGIFSIEAHISMKEADPKKHHFMVTVIDDENRSTSVINRGQGSSRQTYWLNFANSSKKVTVKVAVLKPEVVEFVAQPREAVGSRKDEVRSAK